MSKIRDITFLVFLPIFSASAGLSADLSLLTWAIVPILLIFLFGAIASKFVAAIPAHYFGISWRETAILGALFNTRGLLSLVVGLIGLQTAIITTATFTIFVVMSLVTNLMTLPVIGLVTPNEKNA